MLLEYVQAALGRARYKLLEDRTYFGEIPECPGVWANEPTLERCRETLREVLEGWLVLKLQHAEPLPVVGGRRLAVPHPAHA